MKPSSEKMTPKYDPCRKFRKGDRVQVIRRDGRIGSTSILVGASAIVEEQEDDDNFVILRNPSPKGQPFICIHSLFLRLLAPVEELEPYFVEEGGASFILKIGDSLLANYWHSHPHAQAAAEAERDRLNAEWRKEHE